MAGPHIKYIEALPDPVLGSGTAAPKPDTKNLDALLDSLNGSAERFQTLWFSFLGLTLYLAITALATTHRMLLLGEPQTLPLLNLKVELLPFYIIAPLLYLVFHFYILLMLLLLARTSAEFEDELRKTLTDAATQERYRARIENALFLQLLVGMKDERVGLNSLLLGAIAFLTLMLFPLWTLVLIQMMFLPYHSLPITWWHRAVVVADAGMTLFLWYRLVYLHEVAGPPLLFRDRSRRLITWALAGSFSVVACAVWLSFWEGRWAGEPWIGRSKLDWRGGVVWGLFPDRLKLRNESIVGKTRFEDTNKDIASRGGDWFPTISLDDRDLQAADLNTADLRGVNLTNAIMLGANLEYAEFDDAGLSKVQLQRANLHNARLRGTDLSEAELQGANLQEALLQGANLACAHLQDANLRGAQLHGVDLRRAQLQGADLGCVRDDKTSSTQSWDAGVGGAQSQQAGCVRGPEAKGAELQGANLQFAKLQGANLQKAQLQGSDLNDAQSADVNDADTTDSDPTPAPDSDHRKRLATILGDLACAADNAPYVAQRLMFSDRLRSLGDQLGLVRERMENGRAHPKKCPGTAEFSERHWRSLKELQANPPAGRGIACSPAVAHSVLPWAR
jgi:uncharacterized protein YjbI with pentapeptide repeats